MTTNLYHKWYFKFKHNGRTIVNNSGDNDPPHYMQDKLASIYGKINDKRAKYITEIPENEIFYF